ncbi:hypothetical protein B0J12DRAFT_672928 [Macrophomina phaseolina]|uniref:C2H2-type domain-containing protein n=1 Tax=Macrophomina phaseolina TaxID=35725 RepID=A0ABQ8G2G4_9PEZI|nr:hypothetical protein B0J12DRAFT_672928 [Macrophomina phaseolina]
MNDSDCPQADFHLTNEITGMYDNVNFLGLSDCYPSRVNQSRSNTTLQLSQHNEPLHSSDPAVANASDGHSSGRQLKEASPGRIEAQDERVIKREASSYAIDEPLQELSSIQRRLLDASLASFITRFPPCERGNSSEMATPSCYEGTADASPSDTARPSPASEKDRPAQVSIDRKREIVREVMKEFHERFQDSSPKSWYEDEEYEDDDEDDLDTAELLSPASHTSVASDSSGSSGIRSLPEGMATNHHDTGESSGTSRGSTSTTHQSDRTVRKRGLSTGSNDPDNNDGDGGNGGNKRQKSALTKQQSSQPHHHLACPFNKKSPDDYAETACNYPGFRNVARMKGHLYRNHMRPLFCNRCYNTFANDQDFAEHQRANPMCDILPDQERPLIEGITKEVETKLKSRKQTNLSEPEKWKATYQILFPEESEIPSPYCEQVRAVQHVSPQSQNLADFTQFCHQVALPLVEQALMSEADRQEIALRESLVSRLPEIIRGVLLEVYKRWQAQTSTDNLTPMMVPPPETTRAYMPSSEAMQNLVAQQTKPLHAHNDSTYGSELHGLQQQGEAAFQEQNVAYPASAHGPSDFHYSPMDLIIGGDTAGLQGTEDDWPMPPTFWDPFDTDALGNAQFESRD